MNTHTCTELHMTSLRSVIHSSVILIVECSFCWCFISLHFMVNIFCFFGLDAVSLILRKMLVDCV